MCGHILDLIKYLFGWVVYYGFGLRTSPLAKSPKDTHKYFTLAIYTHTH